MKLDPQTRVSMLEAMITLRASAPAGRREAAIVGVRQALRAFDGRVGAVFAGDEPAPLRPGPTLVVVERSPWSATLPAALAADGADVEAVHAAASALASSIAADGRSRVLQLALPPQPASDDDGQAYADADAVFEAPYDDPVARHTDRLLDAGLVEPGELLRLHQQAEALAAAVTPAPARVGPSPTRPRCPEPALA